LVKAEAEEEEDYKFINVNPFKAIIMTLQKLQN